MRDPAGLAALVNDEVFETWGIESVYAHADTGVSLACLAMRDSGDQLVNARGSAGVAMPIMQGLIFALRASEVPAPVKGATLTRVADGVVFKIISAPRADDEEHSVFKFTVEQVRP